MPILSSLGAGSIGSYLRFRGGGAPLYMNVITTGATVATDGNYRVATFTGSGSFQIDRLGADATEGSSIEYLIVAGGGAGGGAHASGAAMGGGGGAGGLLIGSGLPISTATYTIVVGGGAGGVAMTASPSIGGAGAGGNGSNSGIFSTSPFPSLWGNGGGGGGGRPGPSPQPNSPTSLVAGQAGGSGGGHSAQCTPFSINPNQALGTTGQGNNGGRSAGYTGTNPACGTFAGGGGGGGAGAAAVNVALPTFTGTYYDSSHRAGNGGVGIFSTITGSNVGYAGGGGGGLNRICNGYFGSLTSAPYGAHRIRGGAGGGGEGARRRFSWPGSSPVSTPLTLEQTSATSGNTNTGGGGGGVVNCNPGPSATRPSSGGGGSGVVIIRWRYQ